MAAGELDAMAQLTTAFLGAAHIHTPGFIGTLNKRQDDVRVKAVYDHDAARGEKRAGDMPDFCFVADPQAILY